MSISQHAASARGAYGVFSFTLVVCGGVFYYWLITWFVPRLGLSWVFLLILSLAIAGQMIAAIVPDTESWKMVVHRVAAYGMAVMFLPLGLLILVAPKISVAARILGAVCIAYMIIGFSLLLLGKLKARFLIFQALYVVAFQILILAAAYM